MTALSLPYILLAVLYVECLVGFTVNMIIVVANFMKWKSLISLLTCDKIFSSLAMSRALYFICVALRNSIFQLLPWLIKSKMLRSTVYILTLFMFSSSQWLATLLCVFYCVKIVTYNYKLFNFLKTQISTMVPQFILVSLIISLISNLPLGWFGFKLEPQNLLNGSNESMMDYGSGIVPDFNSRFLIFTVGSFPPFVIFFVANSLLIHFLLIHARRVRSNESHIQSPNLKSHFDALKKLFVDIFSFKSSSPYKPNKRLKISEISRETQINHGTMVEIRVFRKMKSL
ncbi:taste receptor type 2 member 4-like [Hyla sarda]|uniref:taste receptor type 2 member 4-like n=1 Tax=Hyla sarda TaxID=327740 RepID=UPI0024C4210A|nr:taste receptor type 2 member 4-like [Hyla sarda]